MVDVLSSDLSESGERVERERGVVVRALGAEVGVPEPCDAQAFLQLFVRGTQRDCLHQRPPAQPTEHRDLEKNYLEAVRPVERGHGELERGGVSPWNTSNSTSNESVVRRSTSSPSCCEDGPCLL